MTRIEAKQTWEEHLRTWRASGLTQKEFCEKNGLSYWSFKSWAGKLKPGTRKKRAAGLVRINLTRETEAAGERIEIRCNERMRIFVDGATPPERLAVIISALEKRHD